MSIAQKRPPENGRAGSRGGEARPSPLERVRTAPLSPRPLMNGTEAKVFRLLYKVILDLGIRAHVNAQTSLAEMVDAGSRYDKGGAYFSVSARRVDFTVMTYQGRVVMAVEFDGPFHDHCRRVAQGDAIKTAILARVGIPLVRLHHTHDTARQERLLAEGLSAAFGLRSAAGAGRRNPPEGRTVSRRDANPTG